MTPCPDPRPRRRRPELERGNASIEPLTPRQKEVAALILVMTKERGFPPTVRELASRLGVASTNGVNDLLTALERKRRLTRESKAARSLVLTVSGIEAAEKYLRDTATTDVEEGAMP
ncbi:LexA family protein [Myxococcus sp. NMCA1]|uniref:LexA family protein n=1 Tax=Myxococcus sp. NMCA1 TaxID=2996785 RepID=UPI00228600B1|nr:hypothetical protein [Myxococcus sp. NMCA1]WAM23864.1 hypothetical protein OZ403_25315 [Myxococcus sp. NMCA1]